jgi:hypothetical protein
MSCDEDHMRLRVSRLTLATRCVAEEFFRTLARVSEKANPSKGGDAKPPV